MTELWIGYGIVLLVMFVGVMGNVIPGIPGTPLILAGAVGHQLYFCLLYTSPSPRDATLSRMPSYA